MKTISRCHILVIGTSIECPLCHVVVTPGKTHYCSSEKPQPKSVPAIEQTEKTA